MKKARIGLVAGFTGAGKTTYIRDVLLKDISDEKITILQTEIGKVILQDADSLKYGWKLRQIQEGCLCCGGSRFFLRDLKNILEQDQPDRILIELSGTARLDEVRKLLSQEEITSLIGTIRYDYLLDLTDFEKREMISEIFLHRQLEYADRIICSKVSGCEEEKRKEIIQKIQSLQPFLPIIQEDWYMLTTDQRQKLFEENGSRPVKMGSRRL